MVVGRGQVSIVVGGAKWVLIVTFFAVCDGCHRKKSVGFRALFAKDSARCGVLAKSRQCGDGVVSKSARISPH